MTEILRNNEECQECQSAKAKFLKVQKVQKVQSKKIKAPYGDVRNDREMLARMKGK